MADQSRQTPEALPLTDFSEGSNISSPLKPLGPPVAGHNAEELAQRPIPRVMRETSIEEMWKLLDKTNAEMKEGFPSLPTLAHCRETLLKTASKASPEFVYIVYLNLISDMVHKKLAKGAEKKIHFFGRHSHVAEDHPTGTINHPDFFARRDDDKAGQDEDRATPKFHWSALEATGELLCGKDREHSRIKTVSYTSYLLQARPDRLTVQGINVEPKGFRLIVSNARGAFSTKLLDWPSLDFRLLLCAWIWCLYRPIVDPSITATIKGDKRPTFDIKLPGNGGVYKNCTILTVGSAFGRRTTIFQCSEKPNIIIKEQFIETLRGFEEGSILTQIHKEGTFPGVVRLGWHGSVKSEEKGEELVVQWKDPKTGKISERKKTRMVLLDKGISLMDAKTLLEALVAIYDVLEITRFLHTKRGVLHRDISINNVLLRSTVPANTSSGDNVLLPDTAAAPANTSPTDGAPLPDAVPATMSFAKDLQDMCFASHLLKTKSGDQIVGRLDTNVLLIDFDMGEAQKNDNPDKKGPHSRTGTPIFMARAVVSATKKEGEYNLKAMPQLEPHQEEIYKAAVPTRLVDFPPNKREFSEILAHKKLEPFKHQLQYDAESVFWLLLWWAIQALPADDNSPNHKEIRPFDWSALTIGGDDQRDPRMWFVSNFPNGALHPVYKPLETLLGQMSDQLWGYHEEGEDPSRKKDEYLHESFQRLIFQFLFIHYDESFMTAEKSREPREPAKLNAMEAPFATGQINRYRARSSAAAGRADSSSSWILRSGLKRKSISSDEDHGDKDYGASGPQRKRARK